MRPSWSHPTILPTKTSLDAGSRLILARECTGGAPKREEEGTRRRSLKTDGPGEVGRNQGIRILRRNQRLTAGRSLKDFWPWQDPPPDYPDLNSVAARLLEQNKLVSFLLGPQIHLFSPHTDSTAIDTLWPGRTTERSRYYHRGCTTEELTPRARRVPRIVSILFRPTTATLTPVSSPCLEPRVSPSTAELRPLLVEDMYFFANLCTFLLGLAATSSTDLLRCSTTMGSLAGLFSVAATDRLTLRNCYGTV